MTVGAVLTDPARQRSRPREHAGQPVRRCEPQQLVAHTGDTLVEPGAAHAMVMVGGTVGVANDAPQRVLGLGVDGWIETGFTRSIDDPEYHPSTQEIS